MSRSARSALNFAASSFATVVGLGIGFVATPFLLLWLGSDRLGVYRVAIDLFGHLTLLELGVSAALAPLIVTARMQEDPNRLRAVLAAGFRRYLRMAVWTLLIGIGLVFALPELTRTPDSFRDELTIGSSVYLGFVVVSFALSFYKPLAEAVQKSYILSALLTAQGVTVAVLTVTAAYFAWGLIGQFAATVLGSLILPIGLAVVLRPVASIPMVLRPHTDLGDATERVRSLNRLTLLQGLIGRISLFTDNLVIVQFLGPAAVTSFILTQRLILTAGNQLQAIGGATWAGLAELYQSGQEDLFRQRVRELTKFAAALGGAVVVPLAALSKPFVDLWVGPDQYAGDAVVALAVVNAVLLPIFGLWGWVFNGAGRIAALLPSGVIAAILNLILSLIATALLGMPGPLVGTACVYLGYTIWKLPLLMKTEFGVQPRGLLRAVVLPLFPAVLLLAAELGIREMWPVYTWVRLAGEYVGVAVLYLTIAWFVVLATPERALFRVLFRRIFRRFL